jgi:hypothetical protein
LWTADKGWIMERRYVIAGAPEARMSIRVRGMSQEHRFFDEQTSTTRVTPEFIVIRLRGQVDLDSELHITNMRTQVGGTYRVAWTNTRPEEGLYSLGLELLDPEGEIWEPDSIPESQETGDEAPAVSLQCQRCSGKVSIPVPEAETESLREGFIISRHCDTCKSTTGWIYVVGEPPAPEAPSPAAGIQEASPPGGATEATGAPLTKSGGIEHRDKGRAPIRMAIKIMRNKYGRNLSDICETINVSRTGVYFASEQNYDQGEAVEVILPYHPDSVAIPIPARVVRLDKSPGSYQKRVAVHLTFGETPNR